MIPYLIGIGGPSCSGKTELARYLEQVLPGSCLVFSLDSYYRDLSHLPNEERTRCNFDEPASLDDALLVEHISALAEGLAVEKPVYLFDRHVRAAWKELVQPADFVLVEGLFALSWEEIRRRLRTRVYVDVPEHVALARRIERDMRERGRSEESVRRQYAETVLPMSRKHLQPAMESAHVVVQGPNPLSNSAESVLAHVRAQRPLHTASMEV